MSFKEDTKEIGYGFFWWMILVIIALITIAVLTFGSLGISWFSKPAKVAIDNKVFQESQAYNESMQRDLENMQLEYASANSDKKAAIRAVAIHRFSIYKDRLPPDLRTFYNQLEQGQ